MDCGRGLNRSSTVAGSGSRLSLARGSDDCFDFTAAFLFDGMTDFANFEEMMIFGVIIWQTVTPGGGGGYSDIYIHT